MKLKTSFLFFLILSSLIIPSISLSVQLLPVYGVDAWLIPTAIEDDCGWTNGANFIDDDTGTWANHDEVDEDHWVVLDLGDRYDVKKISVYVDASVQDKDEWLGVDIYVSEAASGSWGAAVGTDLAFETDNSWNEHDTTDKVGRYVFIDDIDTKDVTGTNDELTAVEVRLWGELAPFSICTSAVITNGMQIDDELYVFSEEKYYIFNCTYSSSEIWSNITDMRVRFTDGFTTVSAQYLPSTDTFHLLTSQDPLGNNVVRFSFGEAYNTTYYSISVEFEFFFRSWIMDALDVDIQLWANGTDGAATGWVEVATDYFIIYDVGGLIEYGDITGDGAKLVKGDVFEFEVDGATGSIAANWTWKNLQHLHMLPTIEVPSDRIDSAYSGEWSLYYGFYYAVNGSWVDGWNVQIEHTQGFVSPKDFWIQIHVRWYRKGLLKGTSEYFYSFYNPEPEAATTLWVDLWFNSGNFSSIGGGRVSCEFYGMQDDAPWWAFWYSDWGPMFSNGTSSEYRMDLLDDNDNITYTQQIQLVKAWCKLEKTSSTGSYAVRVRDYEVMDKVFNPHGQPFYGIDTPDEISPKVMDMPQGGFFGWLFLGLKNLLKALTPPLLSFWNVFVSFLDTVFALFGWQDGFSTITGWITSFFTWMINGMTWLANILLSVFQLFTSVLTTIIDVFVIFITQWVAMIGFATNLMTGVYTAGVNVVVDYNLWGWMQLIGVVYVIWLFYLFHDDGFDGIAKHFTFIFNAFMFIFNIFLGVAQFVIQLIATVIESIPVVE